MAAICYLGDDDLSMAAVYLAGILGHYGLAFDYVPSSRAPDAGFVDRGYALYVLSDYPHARWQPGQLQHVARAVERGAGVAMFGGWESYHGRLGEYHRSPLVDVLPATMAAEDDRINFAQPCLVRKLVDHPIVDGLPWQSPPGIGGLNRLSPKADAAVLLEAVECSARWPDPPPAGATPPAGPLVDPRRTWPLLIVGRHGRGRTAALACDVAPHWVGGMVDWGDSRVVQDVGSGFAEVGSHYARFFYNLVVWTAGGEAALRPVGGPALS